ncbi:type II secretion system protein GspM [Ectothiorhodospira marina]|jgi:general secretion pathway protein M|uniref:Type II secretion system protein M n=1 Tax=Ectothiorhodospira marina TaxID=1396821 RepID=A0A1H7K4D3_9GAMM|nr:type II secretion system protein M [Ectothiorhodospira marina]SEK80745.1 general secretion pathway protein M [Ectothiorhodospira marina]
MIQAWWREQSVRDRRILIVGGLFLCVALPYWLIWLPLSDRVAAMERDVVRLQGDLAWMEQAASQIRSARGQTQAAPADMGGQSLLGIIDATAQSGPLAGTLRRVQPEGGHTVRVWMENTPFDDMLLWLDELSRQYGVQVSSLVVDRQAAGGRVNVRLVLES